ncbi:MAG: hypothetical protein IJ969_01460 [Anaerotignum sp.]|nr:hypothetical protein [Anaerotignum sp.]MBR2061961.1 hypothetical protein [Anaerotignum sp.]MBR2382589.1 hypothetical protein [Anaerotignum sp.]MBR3910427.1 hypothetical protein [Anaerotignum sp.]MBR3992996.1 hypothetical protein [Anaerotignum sp.]
MAAERYRNTMNGSYYTYGNVAYELQPDYSPYRIREEEEERRKEEARAEKAEARENRIASVKMIAVALVLFIGCIAFMGMNVLVDNAEVSLRQQKNDLDNLKAANAILEAEMAEQLDMDYIKQEATERLGMNEPQSYQVVYIDVPKQSYTVQHNADDAAEGASILAKVTNIWKD